MLPQPGAPGTCPSGWGRGKCQATIREIAARPNMTGLTGWETAGKRQPGPCVTAWSRRCGERHQEGLRAVPQPPACTRARWLLAPNEPAVLPGTLLRAGSCCCGHLHVFECGTGDQTHTCHVHTHTRHPHRELLPPSTVSSPGVRHMPGHIFHRPVQASPDPSRHAVHTSVSPPTSAPHKCSHGNACAPLTRMHALHMYRHALHMHTAHTHPPYPCMLGEPRPHTVYPPTAGRNHVRAGGHTSPWCWVLAIPGTLVSGSTVD